MNSIFYLRNKIIGLSNHKKNLLLSEIENAPKQILFYNELIQNASLKTHTAIEKIYSVELKNKVGYGVLQNRFYKLKKKLSEIISMVEKHDTASDDYKNILHPWEIEYYKCRQLVRQGSYSEALERLDYLEKKLTHVEAYEILYLVNTLQIICVSRLGKIKEINKGIERYNENLDLFIVNKTNELDEVSSKITISLNNLKPYNNFLSRTKRLCMEHKTSKRIRLKYNYLKLEFDNFLNSNRSKKKNTKRVISIIDKLVKENRGLCMYHFSVDYENERDREIMLMKISGNAGFPERLEEFDDQQIRSFVYNSPSFRKFSWVVLYFQKKEDWKNTFEIYDLWIAYCDKNNIRREKFTVEFNKMKTYILAFPIVIPAKSAVAIQQVENMVNDYEHNLADWNQFVTSRDMFYLMITLYSLIIDGRDKVDAYMKKIKNDNLKGVNKIIYGYLYKVLNRNIKSKEAVEQLTIHSNKIEKDDDKKMIEAVMQIMKRKFV